MSQALSSRHFAGIQRWVLVLVLVRALQRNRTNRIYVDIQKAIMELAHAILEAEESPRSAVCRPRNARAVVPLQIQRPEIQGPMV